MSMFITKDWSVYRMTLLLYGLVILFPVNIFIAYQLMQATQTDSALLKQLKTMSVNTAALLTAPPKAAELIHATDALMVTMDRKHIQNIDAELMDDAMNPHHLFEILQQSWNHYKLGFTAEEPLTTLVTKSATVHQGVMQLIVAIDTLAEAKRSKLVNQLYMSLIATMILMIAMIYFIRVSVRLQLERQTIYDVETKLFNREYFDAEIKRACALAIRKQHPIALVAVAIDHFETSLVSLDDSQYDEVMAMMGGLLQSLVRASDTPCRYEEDEFIIITPETELHHAKIVAERIRKHFAEHDFLVEQPLSVSISVALRKDGEESPQMVERLIQSLQSAKNSGVITVADDNAS